MKNQKSGLQQNVCGLIFYQFIYFLLQRIRSVSSNFKKLLMIRRKTGSCENLSWRHSDCSEPWLSSARYVLMDSWSVRGRAWKDAV